MAPSLLYGLLILLLALVAWRLWVYSGLRGIWVLAADGRAYRVHPAHRDRRGAANALAAVHARCILLMRRLRRLWAVRPGARGDIARRILERYNSDSVFENSPLNFHGDTAYTIGKGQQLAMCLREKNPLGSGHPELHDVHDIELLAFVAFHELAHLGVDVRQHPPEFWSAFKFLLAEARDGGILAPVDFTQRPHLYCGLVIDHNPLLDPRIATVPIEG